MLARVSSSPAVLAGYRRLLVPMLGNAESERAIEVACRLAAERATLTAVVVVEVSPLLPLDARMDADELAARSVLRRAEALGQEFGLRVVTRVLRARDAGAAIVELAENADIVVVGAERRLSAHRRLAGFGGTVRTVLRKSPCRVLVVAA